MEETVSPPFVAPATPPQRTAPEPLPADESQTTLALVVGEALRRRQARQAAARAAEQAALRARNAHD